MPSPISSFFPREKRNRFGQNSLCSLLAYTETSLLLLYFPMKKNEYQNFDGTRVASNHGGTWEPTTLGSCFWASRTGVSFPDNSLSPSFNRWTQRCGCVCVLGWGGVCVLVSVCVCVCIMCECVYVSVCLCA